MTAPAVDKRRAGALSILREGRLRLLHVDSDHLEALQRCVARVDGHRGQHVVDFNAAWGRSWACTCRAPAPGLCSHIAAVQLVTGGAG